MPPPTSGPLSVPATACAVGTAASSAARNLAPMTIDQQRRPASAAPSHLRMIFGPYGWILERFDNSHIADRLDVGAPAGIRQRRGERGAFGQVLKDQLMKYLVLSLALVGFAGAAVA